MHVLAQRTSRRARLSLGVLAYCSPSGPAGVLASHQARLAVLARRATRAGLLARRRLSICARRVCSRVAACNDKLACRQHVNTRPCLATTARVSSSADIRMAARRVAVCARHRRSSCSAATCRLCPSPARGWGVGGGRIGGAETWRLAAISERRPLPIKRRCPSKATDGRCPSKATDGRCPSSE